MWSFQLKRLSANFPRMVDIYSGGVEYCGSTLLLAHIFNSYLTMTSLIFRSDIQMPSK